MNLEMRKRAGTSILHLSNGRRKMLFKVLLLIPGYYHADKLTVYWLLYCPYFFLSFFSHPGTHLPNGAISASKSKFDNKIEPSSAKMYFHYYGQLLHQQNMLQDYVRTGYITKLCFIVSFDFVLHIHFEFCRHC